MTVENHPYLKLVAQAAYQIPGVQSITRKVTRFGIQKSRLKVKNKQRLYNFVAADVIPTEIVNFEVLGFNGGKIILELNLKDDLCRQWYYWGYCGYERATVSLYCKLLKFGSCIFDIGANVGYYTLLAAIHLEGAQVHAFEPNPQVFSSLSHNTGLNSLTSVHLSQKAMSDQDGDVCFFLPPEDAASNGSLIQGFASGQKPLMVESIRFDTYCAANNIARVDLIKMDVEGAEIKVLKGMGDLVDRWQPDFICEVLAPFDSELDRFFAERPYRKFMISDDGLVEVTRIRANPNFRDYYLSCNPVAV